MFASNLRNEFAIVIFGYSDITNNFLLNNSDRSIPTPSTWGDHSSENNVSIVSIQADQSRLMKVGEELDDIKLFQSYQFMQINPDETILCKL